MLARGEPWHRLICRADLRDRGRTPSRSRLVPAAGTSRACARSRSSRRRDHLTGWPHGGFVGVDVFFVISGFLITGLLLREHERTGRISFVGFYRRRVEAHPAGRARSCWLSRSLASDLVFNAVARPRIRIDAIWAVALLRQLAFRRTGTDYFAAARRGLPLQHYWSLSVEEQFYFVWPWSCCWIFALLLGRRVSCDAARSVIFGVITVADVRVVRSGRSTRPSTNATARTSPPLSRAWELGIGAMCAVAAPLLHRLPDAVRPVLAVAWARRHVRLVSSSVSSNDGFPAPWAALPVCATALVIVAGTHRESGWQQPFLYPLTNFGEQVRRRCLLLALPVALPDHHHRLRHAW